MANAAYAERIRALVSAGADPAAVNTAGETPIDLVPDDSALWGVLVPFQVAASSGGSAPGAVRNLRVTRVKNEPGPESEHYRDWTWTLTWDTPASDGGHPITEYGYRPVRCQRLGSWQDQARPTPRARSIKMTRARSMKTSFRHIEVISEFKDAWPEINQSLNVASLWAVNAIGTGPCVDVNVLEP